MITVNLENVLKKANITAYELAQRIKASGKVPGQAKYLESFLYKVKRGVKSPSLEMTNLILEVTGCQLTDLLQHTPDASAVSLAA